MATTLQKSRVDWVDCAKGLTIILVVMMHSTLGVQVAMGTTGVMGEVVQFARAFRMPVFFLVAGLFLERTIESPWRTYFDKKILHFAYFYVLWSVIQLGLKFGIGGGNHPVHLQDFLLIPIKPYGTIWFIYILPLFFLITRLAKNLSPLTLIIVAVILNVIPIHTGWIVLDEFAHWYVFFLIGYICAPMVFALTRTAKEHPTIVIGAAFAFAAINICAMQSGLQEAPGLGLVLGIAGAAAVICLCSLFPGTWLGTGLRFCGERSLAIYLAFFLPMAASRIVIVKLGIVSDVDLAAALVTLSAIIGPLGLYYVAQFTPLRFLFNRPRIFRFKPMPEKSYSPA